MKHIGEYMLNQKCASECVAALPEAKLMWRHPEYD
jgi:hypothetical protein